MEVETVAGSRAGPADTGQPDADPFLGKIVYNPDGTAYIFEGSDVGSDVESEVGSILKEGAIVDASHCSGSSSSVCSPPAPIPHVVSAHHISRASATTGLAPQLKVPDVPIMHSYRVFSLRDKSALPEAAEDGDANNNQDEDESVKLAATLTVPVKPILMCFICKISFGYAKSFVSHATAEHGLSPNEAETRLLGQRNTSAIIQGVGKEKEPLLSFLEPKHKSPLLPPAGPQPAHPATTTASLRQQFEQQLMAMATAQAAAVAALRQPSSQSSSCASPARPASNGSLNLVLCKSDDPAPHCSGGGGGGDDCSELADLANLEKIAKAAAAAIQQQPLPDDVSSPKSQSPPAASPKSSSGHLPVHLVADGGHMTMLHSRNSCKTLKCPKCNWHYKYQETLEAHMKEKHPDSDISCLYCLTNQPHPRLSRGETYTCGYKPYCCKVCNYSTTTKGNLSIHMQSDKHINNVQELQNGNIPAEHMAQSQAMVVAVAAAAAAAGTGTGSNSSSPGVPAAEKTSPVAAAPAGPPAASAKPKALWRCDVCHYETNVARNLRIHMTSEKHTHNMLVLQQNMKQMQMQAQQLSALQQAGLLAAGDAAVFHPGLFAALSGGGPGGESGGLQPEAALADMAYNHALLLMASQQQHQQQQRAVAAAMMQQQGKQQATVDMEHPDPAMRLDAVPYDDTCRLLHCCVCTTFSCDTIEALSQHISRDRTGVREDEVVALIPGGPNSAPQQFCKLCEYKSPLKANFQLHCKTDKHLQHLQHVNHMKEGGSRTEWKIKYVKVSNPVQVRCNVCDYYTNSIHKLQMHAATARHESATRVFLHLQLSERIVRASQPEDGDPRKSLYYNCSLCHQPTRSKIALVHHINSVKHLQHENLRQMKLQQQQQMGQLSLKSVDDEIRELFQVKEYSLNDHIVFADDGEYCLPADRALQRHYNCPLPPDARPEPESPVSRSPSAPAHDHTPSLAVDSASASMLKQALQDQVRAKSETGHSCPFCKYTCSSDVKMQMHVLTQHAKQPAVADCGKKLLLRCPLCPMDVSPFHERAALESHLIDNHQVTRDNLDQIFHLLVPQVEAAVPEKRSRISHEESEDVFSGSGLENADARSDSGDSLRDLEANSIEQQAAKFLELGGGRPAAISDRHVYKYRCNQCSLAFKTMEKLQLHSQYHLIRAATQCVVCRRSFRSVEALQRHVETAHTDMTEREEETYRQALANNPLPMLMTAGVRKGGVHDACTSELLRRESARIDAASGEGDEEPDAVPGESQVDDMDVSEHLTNDVDQHHNSVEDYLNSQAVAEDSYNDPSRKFKCHRCKVAFTRQSYLTSHNKTLLHRKGEKMSYPMEKYLDPNRPFKCEICKESFTQKNILLVHYNSVSHLHKLKQAMKDNSGSSNNMSGGGGGERSSPSPTAESQDSNERKVFKCNICKFSTSLSSTLDIHIRSVLHQTRASKLHDLAISGQIDLSQPLIERPEAESGSTVATAKPGAKQQQLESDKQYKLQQQVALNQHLLMSSGIAAGTGSSPAGSQFPCARCGACFSSHESCMQHQQICCLFATAAVTQAAGSPVQKGAESESSSRSQTASEQLAALRSKGYIVAACRSKPPIHKHLLETWGFEIVMQFNENHQKRRRPRESDEKGNSGEVQGHESQQTENEQPAEGRSQETVPAQVKQEPASPTSKNNHLPEINKSTCETCHKDFSSIWVLKAHREEVHKQVVPLPAVESFAAEFRKDYESRAAARPASRDPAAVPQSSDCEQGAANDRRSTPIQTSELLNVPTTSSSASPPNSGMNQLPTQNDLTAASQMAAQMQFTQLLMSMGLAGMGMPGMPFAAAAAMGIPPHLMQLLLGGQMDPVLAAAFNQAATAAAAPSPTPANSMPDPMLAVAQQKLMQQQLSAAQQQKRARTRITDEQLKILRQYFDINNSPTEEQLQEMSEKSGLPLKVIKHWFRNTLFKERQRNKDSPYNFNNPPSTFLNLEEYEKTGETKVMPIDEPAGVSAAVEKVTHNHVEKFEVAVEKVLLEVKQEPVKTESRVRKTAIDTAATPAPEAHEKDGQNDSHPVRESFDYAKSFSMSPHSESSVSSVSTTDTSSQHASQSASQLFPNHSMHAYGGAAGLQPGISPNPLQLAIDVAQRTQAGGQSQTPGSANSRDHSSPGSGSAPGKRANRTRFTDYQIKVLQEFFESNAYPKDDDLEYLSKLLNLSPRVIVVWFQNARQKARKVYENQPAAPDDDSNPGRFQRTPGLNYQCKKCMQVFQRYYELIKHQKSACFKDENPLAVQLKAAQDARQGSSSPGGANTGSNSSTATEKNSSQSPSGGAFRCEKCSLVFPRFDLWREHQLVHLMNPNLFPSYPPTSPFGILQYEGQANVSNNSVPNTPVKRKLPDDEDSQESFSGQSSHTSNQGQDPPRDKRLRTTILPEQLDYLYQKYQIESNPSRKMLENIAKEVGLKKRVVQVWFQNTRARERKGQFRAHQQVIHKRCPFCRALFKARSALESHLATRHADQYTKGDINIDALPDGDPSEDGDEKNIPAELIQMKQYYENSKIIKKYMEEIASGNTSPPEANDLSQTMVKRTPGESPLDLSKPVNLCRAIDTGNKFDDNGFDTRSDNDSESGSDGEGLDEISCPNSPAPGSTTSSVTSPAAVGGNGQTRSSSQANSANKRFRTQMSTMQLKVMKSVFADYKTPSMAECETLGREVGLPKRVVQVWFQNARAKEKKAKLAECKAFGQEYSENSVKAAEECKVCAIRYNVRNSTTSMQDHLFSHKHIENLKNHIDSVKKGIENPEDSVDFPGASAIVMPNLSAVSGDESETRGSQSATNLMQHLQMMGLAGAMPGLGMNGDSKSQKKEQLVAKVTNPGLESKGKEADSGMTGNGADAGDGETNAFAFMFGNSALHNAYFSAAGGFLPNAMYNTSA